MSNQKTERFELLLRPNIAAEAALLGELESLKGIYGGKTELLRECLRRGFAALSAAADACPEQASEDEILNTLASEFRAGEYSYRIGKLFLDARAELKAAVVGRPAAGESELKKPVVAPVIPSVTEQETEQKPPQRPTTDWSRFRSIAGSGENPESK